MARPKGTKPEALGIEILRLVNRMSPVGLNPGDPRGKGDEHHRDPTLGSARESLHGSGHSAMLIRGVGLKPCTVLMMKRRLSIQSTPRPLCSLAGSSQAGLAGSGTIPL